MCVCGGGGGNEIVARRISPLVTPPLHLSISPTPSLIPARNADPTGISPQLPCMFTLPSPHTSQTLQAKLNGEVLLPLDKWLQAYSHTSPVCSHFPPPSPRRHCRPS